MSENPVSSIRRHPRRSRAEVAQMVSSYSQSGLSQSQFCRQHGLFVSSLNRYCQHSRHRDALRSASMNGRLERIKKYGNQSEKLSELQLNLLDLKPAVSSDEIRAEITRSPLSESTEGDNATDKKRRSRQNHPGRNELPAALERIDKIIACAPEFCTRDKCSGDTKVIGYEVSEVLDRKPAAYFVTRIMREKRACAHCIEQGVVTALTPVRIATKSIFSDVTIINFLISRYCDATPLYCQCSDLQRDFDIDVDQRFGIARERTADPDP